MSPKALINRLDHIVLTVENIEATTQFYERALGCTREFFHGPEGQPRHALHCGNQKINRQDRATVTPTMAVNPALGAGDFCVIATMPLEEVLAHLRAQDIPVVAGPVPRRGALGALRSLYLRDPDGNLIEVAEYVNDA